MLRMAVVVDYQNMHLTAHEYFTKPHGYKPHQALIDPFKLAFQIAAAKNATTDSGFHVEVSRIEVFRGIPSAEFDPQGHWRNQKQRDNWMRGRVGLIDVTLRPLKYGYRKVDGRSVPDPTNAQEKGIDVLCALSLVRLARSGHYDVVVLASRDTDLAPAIDEAAQVGTAKIEAVKWFDRDVPHSRGNLPTETKIWTTSLTYQHFQNCLDHDNYS